MKRSGLCLFLLIMTAFLLVGPFPTAAVAQTVSGSAVNQSTWSDPPGLTPPGDGDNSGQIVVGIWNAASTISGTPGWSNVAATAGPLPFGYGSSHSYGIGGIPPGDYQIAAWVDGNANGQYDSGEPVSGPVPFTMSTNPVNGVNATITDDAEGDGMSDWWEVHWFGDTDEPAGEDYDVDGKSNLEEFNISQNVAGLLMLDPSDWDTDSDLMDDGWEYAYYSGGAGADPCTSNSLGDPDGDGLINAQEYRGVDGYPVREKDPAAGAGIGRLHLLDSGDVLDPINCDTDGDGLIDSFEAVWYDSGNGINPKAAGNNGGDPDGDGLTSFREQCLLLGLGENEASDIWSLGPVSVPTIFSPPLALGGTSNSVTEDLTALRAHGWTDPASWDSDGDMLPDGWEVEFDIDPRSGVGNDGFLGDPDSDGLRNDQEYRGQDGNRKAAGDHINGNGDETNPNEHHWRPRSTGAGPGVMRPVIDQVGASSNYWSQNASYPSNGTLGAARPTVSVGSDPGNDSDDDGIDDDVEIQQEYTTQGVGSSPVHSMHPFVKRSARVTSTGGMVIPDPEGYTYTNYRPILHQRNWTIECHVKILSPGNTGNLLICPGPMGLGEYTWRLALSNDVPIVSFDTLGLTRYQVAGLAIPTDQWVHLAGVWDTFDNSLSLYVDGVFVQEQRVYEESLGFYKFVSFSEPTICSSADGSFVANQLHVDEIRIWGDARTPEEVEEFRTQFCPQDSPDLLAYFRFDDGGLTAEDFTKKAKNGLLGADPEDYFFGDHGYALSNGFAFVSNDFAYVRGVDKYGADDTDGDMLPDGWEMVNHLDPLSDVGDDGAAGDPDHDGLENLWEFWSETNPNAEDTDADGILDGNEDHDGDGVVNKTEQDLGSRPDMVDTDDDGEADNEEQAAGTGASNPTDPGTSRCMSFGGAATDYLLVRNAFKQRLSDWTLEAWVNPTNVTEGVGTIIRRVVETPQGGGNIAMNFVLGLEQNAGQLRPYAGYCFTNGTSYYIYGNNLVIGEWVHLAASYDSLNATLRIYTNGGPAAAPIINAYLAPPMNGKGGETFLRIGEDFRGQIDHVRIWNDVRTGVEVANNFDVSIPGSTAGLIHYFRFDDGEANEDVFPFGTYHQPHGPQDFVETEDWQEEWFHAAIMNGNVNFTPGGALLVPPSVRVILDPQEARDAGAQWSLDGGGWRDSGDVIADLDTHNMLHTVAYRSVAGWTAPATETITVTNGVMTTLTRSYVQKGSLKVSLEPPQAVALGAAWAVDGGAWQATDMIVSNLSAGGHTVSFKEVPNWTEPSSMLVTVNPGEETAIVAFYTEVMADLRVLIYPAEVVSNGAVWRVDSGAWRDSGQIASNLTLGSHTVEFLDVTPWTTPDDITFNVVDDTFLSETGMYFQVAGIQVIITPAAAIAEGAQWRVDGGTWQDSGTILETGPGSHSVGFKTIESLMGPSTTTVDVETSKVSQIYANYYDMDLYGAEGTGLGMFKHPRGLAVLGDRLLYVADTDNHRIQVLDVLTGAWSSMGGYGTAPGQFNQPFGVALDSAGNLWVADANNHRVQRRDAASGAWTVYGGYGTGLGQFNGPWDVEVDSDGNVYVADHYNNRVQKRSSTGAWSILMGNGRSDGMVRRPSGLAIDSLDLIYVSDHDSALGESRVQVMSKWGVYKGTIGTSASDEGDLWKPRGIAVGPSDEIYLADTGNDQIQELVGTGTWAIVIGSILLDYPEGIECDSLGNLYIADTMSDRILRLPAKDADMDGLPDWTETDTGTYVNRTNTGTDPNDTDTDNDGYGDGWEVDAGTDPFSAASIPLRTVADFNRDGRTDKALFIWNGRIVVKESGTGFEWKLSSGHPNWVPAIADYDGDGAADIAWYVPREGGLPARWRIHESSNNYEERDPKPEFGGVNDTPIPADFDGDGRADLAVFKAKNGKIKTPTWESAAPFWPQPSWLPAVADYDGDLIADLAWFIPSTSEWRIYESSNAFAERLPRVTFGGTAKGPIPVPADFNGDGMADLAVFRKTTGKIRVFESGTAAKWTSISGWPGWLPAVGDYNGDGRADCAWYRTDSLTFFIEYSDADNTNRADNPTGRTGILGDPASWPITTPLLGW